MEPAIFRRAGFRHHHDPMIALVWFTCAKDYAAAAESRKASLAAFPEAKTIAAIDIAERDAPSGFDSVLRTTFKRGGNLTATDAPEGVTLALLDAANLYGADHVIKVDSDTVILSPAFAEELTAGRADVAAWRMSTRAGFGACYGLSHRILRRIMASFRHSPPITAREDCEIIGRAAIIAGIHCWPVSIETMGDDPKRNTMRQFRGHPLSQYDGAHVIHCGLVPDTVAAIRAVSSSRK